jgi:hypothetical protein
VCYSGVRMSESFVRGAWYVSFSSGAFEALLGALVILGERTAAVRTQGGREVVAFLRERLARKPGARAFRLEPVIPELDDPARLRMLAMLVGEFAHDLARAQPDRTLTDVAWTRDLRLSWLAQVELLHEMLADALPKDEGAAPLLLELDDATAAEVDAERLLHIYRMVKRGPPADAIAHIDRALALLATAGATRRRAHTVVQMMGDKADLLVKTGDRKRAAKTLCEAARLSTDAELAQAMLDYAASLDRDP